ncbi:dATP pyrophosphohydrolase [Paenibacillus sp. JGP012]|uniref:NUDIX hydrolase n=1 Tax=Paenibacillus sp. JGP012 TaxID=2735914 RepID=UPI0017B0034E|nr:NUDIX domain-containing protein [Paenibacillus sp. JGP012]MBB6021135.1 dATP pyrophosphohydrolase [Paenibacillus sp. JGP012]
MDDTVNAQGVNQANQTNQADQLGHSHQNTQAIKAAQADQSTKDTPAHSTDPSKQTVPIRCEGVAAVLMKKYLDQYHVLMLKRAGRMLHNEWCYIGGGIEYGEKAWEAALREIREETGITEVRLYSSNQFEQFYSPTEDYIYMAPVFVGYVREDQPVQLNHEHSEHRWMTFEEAKQHAALPGIDDILDFVEKHFAKKAPSKWLKINGD